MTSFYILPDRPLEERAEMIVKSKCYCAGGADASCLYCFTLAQLNQVRVDQAMKDMMIAQHATVEPYSFAIHPDIPFNAFDDRAKGVAHQVAHGISAEIGFQAERKQ